MNSNPYGTHDSHNPDDEISDSQSDGSSNSSASSSRADRLRRERTQRQRHRQRLLRAKQLQQHTQQHQHQQHSQSQQHQQSRERSSSESSNGSAASSGVGSSRRQLTQSSPTSSGVSSNAGSSTNGNSPTRQARGGAANSDNTANTTGIVTQQILTNQQAKQAQSSSQQRPQQNQPQQPQQYSQNSLNFQNGPRKAPSSEQTENSITSPSSPHGSNSRAQQSNVKAPPPPPSNPPNISNNSNNASSSTSQQQSSQQQPQQKPPPPPPMISSHKGPVLVSVESPLPPLVQRSLGDRSYDKRKNAALEIEQLVKSLSDAHNIPMIQSIISVLAKDFCTSMNANYRKGGLIGIAATAIGLMGNTRSHLEGLLFPVLHCFDDPESRVRYYACESLYNIAKVARGSILRYFNQIFDGLTKLFADVDVDVKNGANLLDRLVKDIVTESESFHVEQFLPLLQSYIRRTNPYIRQLLVGWITVLDSVPDISMIDYLPDFLDGLFNMLSDSNREIRQAADSALSDFLKEVRHSTVLEFGPLVSILVHQCLSKERLNRLTAITWIEELIHHPHSGGDELLPHHAEVLGAILFCISDLEEQICLVAERTNADLLTLVRDTHGDFRLAPLLETLIDKFVTKDDVPTKMASLRWINMLLEKRRSDMTEFVPRLMPVLLKTLSDSSDSVVLFTLQVLARISLGDGGVRIDKDSTSGDEDDMRVESQDNIHSGLLRGRKDAKHFKLVINAILKLFASDRILLESRGSLVIRKLCVLLDAESVYMLCASILSSSCESSSGDVLIEDNKVSPDDEEDDPSSRTRTGSNTDTVVFPIEFISTMVQTLNLMLLTASELHGLRALLANTFDEVEVDSEEISCFNPRDENTGTKDGVQVFETLFRCWCHSPVATFSLCLLARSYRVAFALVQKFSELEVTVGFLMQIDKLVQLLESPIFVHLRLQLLDVESPHHAPLLKSCYGLLMLLPQSDAFRNLNDRLTTVCNLRDNLGIPPTNTSRTSSLRLGAMPQRQRELLTCFDEVMDLHRKMRGREVQQMMTGDFLNDRVNRGRQSSDSVGTNGKLSSTRVKVNGNGPGSVGGSSTGGIASNRNTPSSVFFPSTDNNGGSSSTTNNSSAPIRGKITQEV